MVVGPLTARELYKKYRKARSNLVSLTLKFPKQILLTEFFSGNCKDFLNNKINLPTNIVSALNRPLSKD